MIPESLSRLVKVELREIWASEPGDFTPWLAQAENLTLLGDTIGIELELEAQEKEVGPFRADILCKDTATGAWVLIENQLERTDHVHLGQLLTYAAGLKAVTIVWIAYRFTDEHRAALDWLNEVTDERFNFFGLEVELWRIGSSPAAPKFNIVSKPNDWSKDVARGATRVGAEATTEKELVYLDFWTAFREYALEHATRIKIPKPSTQNWMSVAIGRTDFFLCPVASFWSGEARSYEVNELRVELVMQGPHATAYFALLRQMQVEIERDIGEPLTWYDEPKYRQRKIFVRRDANLADAGLWPEYHAWLLSKLEAFHRVFAPIVKTLDAADWLPPAHEAIESLGDATRFG